jgi:tetratricopeptide (TPR) repeat protein
VAAVLLAVLPFILLEVGLRLAGYGYDTQLVTRFPPSKNPQVQALNSAVDRAYFGRGDLPGPEARPFRLPKPPGTFRIVVVGGSSVLGFPFPSELSFPRQLEVILQAQNPDRRFEVLNAGIVAITSFSEVDIARQAENCSPDLIVIHSGHNEFYGVGGLASTAGGTFNSLYPLLEAIRRQRIFQLGASFVSQPIDKHLPEVLPADIEIPLRGPTVAAAEKYYRENLEQIARQAALARVPLVLTTIPANLRDLSPMSSLRATTLTAELESQQAERLHKIEQHISYQEYEQALEQLELCRQLEPQRAVLAYRRAQCLEKLQRRDEARQAYREAADADGCRLRAPSQFERIVRETAARHTPAVLFCDVAEQLQSRSALAAPGNDFFLEHVHYNLEGHWTIALILAEYIQSAVLQAAWQPERVPDPQRRAALLGLTPFDPMLGDTMASMILQVWPLKLSPDSAHQAEYFADRLRAGYAGLNDLDKKLFAELSLPVMQHDLVLAMGLGYRNAGELDKALRMFELHMHRRPWDVRGYEQAAAVLEQKGQLARAVEVLDSMQRLVPLE